jgi:hypothetical protein
MPKSAYCDLPWLNFLELEASLHSPWRSGMGRNSEDEIPLGETKMESKVQLAACLPKKHSAILKPFAAYSNFSL